MIDEKKLIALIGKGLTYERAFNIINVCSKVR